MPICHSFLTILIMIIFLSKNNYCMYTHIFELNLTSLLSLLFLENFAKNVQSKFFEYAAKKNCTAAQLALVCMCIYMSKLVCVRVCVHVCVYIYVYIYTYIYTYICILIHTDIIILKQSF
jgi:hypothetical protein